MLVSAIICTYRSDAYEDVLEAVASVLNQTYPSIEVIIVVDGNEWLRQKIAAVYDSQNNIQVIASKENIGASGARNLGIGRARGIFLSLTNKKSNAK